ncbi:DNA-deoxyinosine glycosylase [Sulfuricurvum sp.]|uniref:DNA-deoxyinosine glycosylase n=1 Tax=Sulfuricurvum sp. TaxID=2025608 RepID=UPI003562CCB4
MESYSHPFPPIINASTRILFLGSFPSIASFEQVYFKINLSSVKIIFHVRLETNEAKKTFCLEKGIGLWDVISSCERSNSSDTNLKNCLPNNFETLLNDYPNIKVFAFTGKKSYDLFLKYYKNLSVEKVLLPSTSPAHAAMKREEKTAIYKAFLNQFLTV